MAFIQWEDKLSVFDDIIDNQHQHLISLVNKAYEMLKNQGQKEDVAKLIQELILYVQTHFSHEEKFMKINKYPDIQEHIEAHQDLTKRVGEVKSAIEAGNINAEKALFNLLNDWLVDHIINMDGRYAKYFKESNKKILPV